MSAPAVNGAAGGEAEIVTVAGAVTSTIVLNRPDKLNSLSMNMVTGLVGAYEQIKQAGSQVVVIKGEGRAFCAGGDVASVREAALTGGTLQNRFFYDGDHCPLLVLYALRAAYAPERVSLPQRLNIVALCRVRLEQHYCQP